MPHYLLSVHEVEGERGPAPDDIEAMMARIQELEARMESEGALLVSGALHGVDMATVVRNSDGDVLTTDGPFAEAKERIAGFYILDAPDMDKALAWAADTSACVGRSIEVRPFHHLRAV